jgi:septal ring factor EnvC (AmiA/AmiB activator)
MNERHNSASDGIWSGLCILLLLVAAAAAAFGFIKYQRMQNAMRSAVKQIRDGEQTQREYMETINRLDEHYDRSLEQIRKLEAENKELRKRLESGD